MLRTLLCCFNTLVLHLVYANPRSRTWAGFESTAFNYQTSSTAVSAGETPISSGLSVDSGPVWASGLSTNVSINLSSIRSSAISESLYSYVSPARPTTQNGLALYPNTTKELPLTNGAPYNKTWLSNSSITSGFPTSANSSENSTTTLEQFLTTTIMLDDPGSCCFAVQDTLNVRYWAHYATTIVSYTINATYFITSYTHYIDTIVTNYNASVTALPTSSALSFDIAIPQIPPYNNLPGPMVTFSEMNGTQTTTDGRTITSPAAFYEISTVRIILVPPVTDQNGEVVCTTTSTYQIPCTSNLSYGGIPFPGINAYAESYFSGVPENVRTANSTMVERVTLSDFMPQTVAEIQLSTPFIYLPLEGAIEGLKSMPTVEVETSGGTVLFAIDYGDSTTMMENDNSKNDYGYVPQALIDWVARDPNYVSQYPYLASCYPGGPSIKPDNLQPVDGVCDNFVAGPIAMSAVPDFTTSTQVTVSGAGCFHPGACPTPAPAAAPKLAVPANTALPIPSKEASVAPSAPDQSQSPQAIVANSLTTALGLGGIILSALGGAPFAPSQNAPSLSAPTPTTPSPNAPSPDLSAPNVPILNVPLQSAPPRDPEGGQHTPSGVLPTPAIDNPPLISLLSGPTSFEGVIAPPGTTDTGYVVDSPMVAVSPQSITFNSASKLVLGGQTLTPGAPAINIQGTLVSLGSLVNAVIVAPSTTTLPTPVGAPAITVASQPITLDSASHYVVAGKTLTPGGPPVSIEGTLVSLAPSASAILVAGSTNMLSSASPSLPALVVGSQTLTANSASAYVITGQGLVPGLPGAIMPESAMSIFSTAPWSLSPPVTGAGEAFTPNPTASSITGNRLPVGGAVVTISGTLVSLGPSGSLVIGTSTTVLPKGASPSVFTVGDQTFTANPTAFSIAGTKISSDGPEVTISGTPVSLGVSGRLVIGTSTAELSPVAFTVGNQVFTPNPTAFSIAGTTISAGGRGVTIAGTPVSLGVSGRLVIGTSTAELSPVAFTVGNQVFTPNPTAFQIAGTTISAGGRGVTIAGTPVELTSSGSFVIGNSTTRLWTTGIGGVLGSTGQASGRGAGLRYEFLGLIVTCAVMLEL